MIVCNFSQARHFNPNDFEEMGRAFCDVVLEYEELLQINQSVCNLFIITSIFSKTVFQCTLSQKCKDCNIVVWLIVDFSLTYYWLIIGLLVTHY